MGLSSTFENATLALLLGIAEVNCFGGQAAIGGQGGVTNLAPLPLRLPAPASGSWVVSASEDPHLEPLSPGPRPPFLAPVSVTNLALHKRVMSSDKLVSPEALGRITDGRKDAQADDVVHLRTKKQWVQVDLEAVCRIHAVVIWHGHDNPWRVFRCVVVQTAEDAEFTRDVRTLFNNDYENEMGLGVGEDKLYRETFEGRLVDGQGVKGRYVRCYSKGNNLEPFNAYAEVEVWGLREEETGAQ